MRAARVSAVLLTTLVVIQGTRAADLATRVPGDAFLYAEVIDPRGIWSDFGDSAAWDAVRSLPGGEFRFRAAAGAVQQMLLAKLGIRWGEFVDRYVQRAAVVLLDVPLGPEVKPCLLLDAAERQADLEALLRGTVEPTLRASTPGTGFDEVLHQGVTVRLVNLPERTIAYAFLDGQLVVGAYSSVKALIGARARRPLAASVPFARARHRLAPSRGLLVCLNVSRLLEEARPRLEAHPGVARALDDVGLTGVQFALAALAFDGRRVRETVYLHTGGQRLGLIRLLSSLSSGRSRAADVLPQATPGFLAVTFKDGPELWDAILEYMAEGGEAERMARLDANQETLRLRFGIDFHRDFVRALGGEAFLAANPGLAAEGLAPGRSTDSDDFPFILGFRVADREALEVTLHRLILSQPVMGQGVQRTTTEHHGVRVNRLSAPARPLRPAYAFVSEYLLVAKSADILRQCIDAQGGKQSLQAALSRADARSKTAPARHNALAYVNLQRLASKALDTSLPRSAGELVAQLGTARATITADTEGLTLTLRSPLGLLGTMGLIQSIRTLPRSGGRATTPAP